MENTYTQQFVKQHGIIFCDYGTKGLVIDLIDADENATVTII